MPAAAVLLCMQVENSLACHCKYTCEFLSFIQLCSSQTQMHKNSAQDLCMLL
jgi:hypothetical protein